MEYNTGRNRLIISEYGRNIQKMIEQHFILWKMFPNINNVVFQLLFIDNDLHTLTTQYVGWPY